MAENFDLTNIVTPVNVEELSKLCRVSGYDMTKTCFLERGFTNRFHIGYRGNPHRESGADNLPFKVGNKTILWNKLMKEVMERRVAGPFREVPFENFMQSPIGLVPKDNGKQTRLIFHLSYEFKDGFGSLNSNTPERTLFSPVQRFRHSSKKLLGSG